jgi:hypothetical protein
MLEKGEKAQPPPEGSKIPSSISRAVMRGLETDRAKRFPTLAALVHELTPPPQRSPVRYIAAAAVAAVLVGGVAAAMMVRPDPMTRQEGLDEPTIDLLIRQINERDQQIKQLREVIAKGVKDREELAKVRQELEDKQEENRMLTEQLLVLSAKHVTPVGKPVPLPPTNKQITAAVQTVYQRVEFCLDDLESRRPATEGAPKRGEDITFAVHLTVSDKGKGSGAKVEDLDYSPSVRDCVRDALLDVPYPRGSEPSDIEIAVVWVSGNLAMTGRILGTHFGGSTLDDL